MVACVGDLVAGILFLEMLRISLFSLGMVPDWRREFQGRSSLMPPLLNAVKHCTVDYSQFYVGMWKFR